MAYSIQYEEPYNQKYKISIKRKFNFKIVAAVLCVVAVILVWSITPIRLAVLDLLLPGNGAVTRQAAGNMIDDLKQGEPLKEAFTDFCIEIIQNA